MDQSTARRTLPSRMAEHRASLRSTARGGASRASASRGGVLKVVAEEEADGAGDAEVRARLPPQPCPVVEVFAGQAFPVDGAAERRQRPRSEMDRCHDHLLRDWVQVPVRMYVPSDCLYVRCRDVD